MNKTAIEIFKIILVLLYLYILFFFENQL